MSLDIYAKIKGKKIPEYETIDTSYRTWSREERRKHCTELTNKVLKINITHNLCEMASKIPIIVNAYRKKEDRYFDFKSNLYKLMWRPEEIFTDQEEIKLSDVCAPLCRALSYLLANEKKLSKYNPENGWGHYENFVYCLPQYIRACYKWPNAVLEVDR